MIEAVIFDLDGLLIDSEGVWNAARQEIAREAGHGWTDADRHACMGVSTQTWAGYMRDRLGLDWTVDQVIDRMIGHMLAHYRRGVPYLPGAVDAVDLAARHYPVAIASGSHRTLLDAVTADPALAGKFRIVVCSDEVPAGKPAPDVYLAAARKLGIAPEHCVCLEDSGAGIRAGHAAGMAVIAVPDPEFPPPAADLAVATVVLPSLCAFDLDLVARL